ncbi:hypothetical protein [Shewanella surugensis]|uniref:Uncharacterized protein n=1 Tax=Shewanella surugensis TaxID=212020 RepID=A0ABT0LEY0_9GAMM|nr:hypothetical protein [Shewanella surugensis]MCL1126266.1 hypothetical protein [Shewanella surugensis]
MNRVKETLIALEQACIKPDIRASKIALDCIPKPPEDAGFSWNRKP